MKVNSHFRSVTVSLDTLTKCQTSGFWQIKCGMAMQWNNDKLRFQLKIQIIKIWNKLPLTRIRPRNTGITDIWWHPAICKIARINVFLPVWQPKPGVRHLEITCKTAVSPTVLELRPCVLITIFLDVKKYNLILMFVMSILISLYYVFETTI